MSKTTTGADKIRDIRKQLRLFRFQMTGGRSKNVREGRNLRHSIARILTVINAQK